MLIAGLSLAVFLPILFFVFRYFQVKDTVPSAEELMQISNAESSQFFYSNGALLGLTSETKRISIPFDSIPSIFLKALITTEDKRFYTHNGVDNRATLRVIFKSLLVGDKSSGGGSTLTQQLVKNLYPREKIASRFQFLNRKIWEALTAKRIESLYSKNEILELYVNTVPFGEEVYGLEMGSKRFFNKGATQLDTLQAITLVATLKATSSLNPFRNPQTNQLRRNLILRLLYEENILTEHALAQFLLKETTLNYTSDASWIADNGYFLTEVRKELRQIFEQDNINYSLESDGLKIYTTLNQDLQNAALNARKKQLKAIQKQQDKRNILERIDPVRIKLQQVDNELKENHLLFSWDSLQKVSITKREVLEHELKQIHASVFAIENETGATQIYVGGNHFQLQPFNLVKSKRQAASTFKPFVFATLLNQGYGLDFWLENKEIILPEYENWSPSNSDKTVGGFYSILGALALSKNIPTVNAWNLLEFDSLAVLHKLLFNRGVENNPAAALGTNTYSLWELVSAYSVFANLGYSVSPYTIDSITTNTGKVIYKKQPERKKKKINGTTAKDINYALLKAVENGTASSLQKQGWAGKTGTAQNGGDTWFIAYNKELTVGAWVGAQFPIVTLPPNYASGAKAALPIIKEIIKPLPYARVLTNEYSSDIAFYREENVIDKITGIFKKDKTRKKSKKENKSDDKKEKKFLRKIFGN
ncbi:MAG: transglycosylase domain-containing protein [Luteibaculaceae bacterium]